MKIIRIADADREIAATGVTIVTQAYGDYFCASVYVNGKPSHGTGFCKKEAGAIAAAKRSL